MSRTKRFLRCLRSEKFTLQGWGLTRLRRKFFPPAVYNSESDHLLSSFLQRLLASASRCQHFIKRRLLAQVLQQRILQQRRVCAIILLHRGLQQSQSRFLLPTVGHQCPHVIPQFRVGFHHHRRLRLSHHPIHVRRLLRLSACRQQIPVIRGGLGHALHALPRLGYVPLRQINIRSYPRRPLGTGVHVHEIHGLIGLA